MAKVTLIELGRRGRWFLTQLRVLLKADQDMSLDDLNRAALRLALECLRVLGHLKPYPGTFPEVLRSPGRGRLDSDDKVRLDDTDKKVLECVRGCMKEGKKTSMTALNVHGLLIAEGYLQHLRLLGEYPEESIFDSLTSSPGALHGSPTPASGGDKGSKNHTYEDLEGSVKRHTMLYDGACVRCKKDLAKGEKAVQVTPSDGSKKLYLGLDCCGIAERMLAAQ